MVLVTGAGPIGSLCVAVAAETRAAESVVTDLEDRVLDIARQMGATHTINLARNAAEMERLAEDRGCFDLAFESSAAVLAIRAAVASLRPRGVLLQVGVAGDTPMPVITLVAKEARLQGTHRFHDEFTEAVQAITSGRIDPRPIITGRYPLERAAAAFAAASDRSHSVTVHLEFSG